MWCIKTFTIAYVKIQKRNEGLQSIMSNLQPIFVDFQKVDKHTGGKWLIHDTKRHKEQSVAKPETSLQNIQAE